MRRNIGLCEFTEIKLKKKNFKSLQLMVVGGSEAGIGSLLTLTSFGQFCMETSEDL